MIVMLASISGLQSSSWGKQVAQTGGWESSNVRYYLNLNPLYCRTGGLAGEMCSFELRLGVVMRTEVIWVLLGLMHLVSVKQSKVWEMLLNWQSKGIVLLVGRSIRFRPHLYLTPIGHIQQYIRWSVMLLDCSPTGHVRGLGVWRCLLTL